MTKDVKKVHKISTIIIPQISVTTVHQKDCTKYSVQCTQFQIYDGYCSIHCSGLGVTVVYTILE